MIEIEGGIMQEPTGCAHLQRAALDRRRFVMTGLISGFTLATARAEAEPIHTDAAGLVAGEVSIPVGGGLSMPAYFARPATGGTLPVVLVNEEIFGIHEYMHDICRRLAKQGYLAAAPEIYFRNAEFPHMTESGQIFREVIQRTPDAQVMADLDATLAWAGANHGDAGRVGVVGFCRGGRNTWLYAAHNPGLKAAVAFYGPLGGAVTDIQPKTALDVAGDIHCPLLGLYGGQDSSIPVDAVRAAEARAKAAGKTVEIVIYPDAGHGFHADYRPSYNRAAAEDGWRRMLAWFGRYGVVPQS
jgi:carboxymethylenebutenolidase